MTTSFFKRAADAQPVEREERNDTESMAEQKPAKQSVVRPTRRPESLDSQEWSEASEAREERNERGFQAAKRYSDRSASGVRDFTDRRERPARPAREDRPARPDRDYADRGPKKERRERVVEPKEAPENVIFGIHPLREAIEAERPIEKLYLRRSKPGDRGGEAIKEIENMATMAGINMQFVPVEKLDRLTRRNNHQGVVAVLPPIEYAEIADVLDLKPTLLLVLDGVTDVRNFGAIARSAECAGVNAIVVGAKNCAPINGEAMKSSAGALSRIPVCRVGSLRNTLRTIQLAGVQLVAATEKSDETIYETNLSIPTAIIMGSEERGISSDTLKLCDAKASIPLTGVIESLNVSAAAAVLLFEASRQRSVLAKEV